METTSGRRGRAFFWTALCLAIAGIGLQPLLPTQDRGEPVHFRPDPSRKGQGYSLPRGEALLFELLQGLAHFTGESVYYSGGDPPQTTIVLPRAVARPDLKAAREILQGSGYEITRETYKGKAVYWVRRSLVPPTKKGRIIRGPRGPEEKPPEDQPQQAGEGRPSPKVSFYEREAGPGGRFLIIFQTDSREGAEEALSLLEALERSK